LLLKTIATRKGGELGSISSGLRLGFLAVIFSPVYAIKFFLGCKGKAVRRNNPQVRFVVVSVGFYKPVRQICPKTIHKK
jgi:hypothetical protein